VQLKIDAEFPRFTQGMLETVFPHYLAPTPSMCVAQFIPDMAESALAQGVRVPRGTTLRSPYGLGTGERTQCEYRTAHPLTLWPVEVSEAKLLSREMGSLELPEAGLARARGEAGAKVKSALRLVIRSPGATPLGKTEMDSLTLFVRGNGSHPMRLYEQLLGHARAVVLRPVSKSTNERRDAGCVVLDGSSIRRVGFEERHQLLPYDARSFQGYRLLAEYFAFPQRFMFVEFTGLRDAVKLCKGTELEVVVLLDDDDATLDGVVEASNFVPHCTPAVNLFPRSADRIFVNERTSEFHVIADRTRPLEFEVFRVTGVTGFGARTGEERVFRPLFATSDAGSGGDAGGAYYVVNRVPRVISEREREQGRRSSYAGSEAYVSIVDEAAAPHAVDLRQLGVETLCTNRDLPLQMPLGKGKTDFTLEIGAAVTGVRVVAGPTRPKASAADGETAWRLVSHQALNYLSLTDTDERKGAAALRDMLVLYGDMADPVVRKQVEAVRSVTSRGVTRRVPTPGPITFGRGLEVTVTMEERGFEGTGVFALGAVLEQFFARYVGLNSFTETVVKTVERDVVMRWPARIGQRPLL
jgi:type VI secretion system protein ImpG